MSIIDRPQCRNAELVIQGRGTTLVTNLAELHSGLMDLDALVPGQVVVLAQGPKHYIKAIRHREGWAVTTRRGSYLTLAGFTASLTTEYSQRQVRRKREATSLRQRIVQFLSESPERSLSSTQVITLFSEYLTDKKFSISRAGA